MGSIITGWWLCILQTGWENPSVSLCFWMSLTNFQVFSETTDIWGQVLFPLSFWKMHIIRNILHVFLIHLLLNIPNLALQELDSAQKAYWTIFEAVLQKQEVTIHQMSSKFELERVASKDSFALKFLLILLKTSDQYLQNCWPVQWASEEQRTDTQINTQL